MPWHERGTTGLLAGHGSGGFTGHVLWQAGGLCGRTCAPGRRLAEFVAMDKFPSALMQRLEPPALEVLIRLTAASCRPCYPDSDLEKGEGASPAMVMSDRMQGFMNRLASIPSRDAMNALAELSVNERLRAWQSQLVDAAYRQNAMYREASFRHCDIEPVIEVLDRRRPANAGEPHS